ncbi:hypothetical protein BaRGS_00002305, partial [Batillaria attramentaria]
KQGFRVLLAFQTKLQAKLRRFLQKPDTVSNDQETEDESRLPYIAGNTFGMFEGNGIPANVTVMKILITSQFGADTSYPAWVFLTKKDHSPQSKIIVDKDRPFSTYTWKDRFTSESSGREKRFGDVQVSLYYVQ